MLSRKDYLQWSAKDQPERQYKSDDERRFYETLKNPPKPTEELKEIVREYGKYAK